MLTTGSFAKLFIANRFSKCDISSKLKYFDNEERKLLNSLNKQGLKEYMQNDCDLKLNHATDNNEEQKNNVIKTHNLIITKTLSKIMCHYPKLYQSLTSYNTKNDQTYYHKVFNINELVIYIFQYFNDIESIINCSMIDSIWLINAFHSNCTKYFKLVGWEMNKLSHGNEYYCMRQWLRFERVSALIMGMGFVSNSQHAALNVKWINFENMNQIFLLQRSSKENVEVLEQLLKLLCCKINGSCHVKQSLNKIDMLITNSNEFNTFIQSNHEDTANSTLNASRYTSIKLCGTKPFFQIIVGPCCQKLTMDENAEIDIKQSNFSGVEKLHLGRDSSCTLLLQQFLKNEIYLTKINDLRFDIFDKDALSFWQKHQKYLQNNSGKISFHIDVEKLLNQNVGTNGNNIYNNTNYIQTLFDYINNHRLGHNIAISKLSVKLHTSHAFNIFRDALISTTDFKSNIEILAIRIGFHSNYDFASSMGSTKISGIFFDECSTDDKRDKPIINISKLTYLEVTGMKLCNVEHVLDLINVVCQRAKISQNIDPLSLRLHIYHVFCTSLSSMNQLLDLIYHIIVVIRYPVCLNLTFEFENDNFEYNNQYSNMDKVMERIKKQFDSFQQKLRSNYQQPFLQTLKCQCVKVPYVTTICETTTGTDDNFTILECNTSDFKLLTF